MYLIYRREAHTWFRHEEINVVSMEGANLGVEITKPRRWNFT